MRFLQKPARQNDIDHQTRHQSVGPVFACHDTVSTPGQPQLLISQPWMNHLVR